MDFQYDKDVSAIATRLCLLHIQEQKPSEIAVIEELSKTQRAFGEARLVRDFVYLHSQGLAPSLQAIRRRASIFYRMDEPYQARAIEAYAKELGVRE